MFLHIQMTELGRQDGHMPQCTIAMVGACISCSIAVKRTCMIVTQVDSETLKVNCAHETS